MKRTKEKPAFPETAKIKLSPKLERFLREEYLLLTFKRNAVNLPWLVTCNRDNVINNPASAFEWTKSPEGFNFWNDVYIKFDNR